MTQFGAELSALVDTMIPGDGEFPSASAVGTHAVVAIRLREFAGPDAVPTLVKALRDAGGPLAPLDADGRIKVVAAFEAKAPEWFVLARMAIYLAYYEQPDVVEAVRGLGFDYNDAPQPKGYELPPFDPEIDAPRHNRGMYVPTDEVRRVDLTGLDFLQGAGR